MYRRFNNKMGSGVGEGAIGKLGNEMNSLDGTMGCEECLEGFGIRKYINLVVASAEEGVAKQD